MTDAIFAEGLVKRYGKVTALDGIDLAVPQGSVLAMLGPNGAGKTTTVRVLTTLLVPDEGRATVAGVDVLKDPRTLRSKIGASGQYAAVDEYLTGFENLEMVGRLYHLGTKRAKERARELLDRFSLTEAADRPVKGYSGGMRRRLDLAGALVANPEVLFLDEPTTGLDPRARLELWDVIAELVAGGTTLLLTTQYMEEAERLADSIVVIDRGAIIERGTADELKARVGGERIELVVRDESELATAQRALQPMAYGEIRVEPGIRRLKVPIRGGSAALVEAIGLLNAHGVGVNDVGLRRPTLDDVFLALTGHEAESGRGIRGPQGEGVQPMNAVAMAATDGATIAKRNLIKIKRVPDLIVFTLLSPVMFVLLFAYIFGSAIEIPGMSYREFLIAGIFTQTVIFGATWTGLGLAEDMQKGIIDRFRSLPMAPSAVLIGRTTSDVAINVISLIVDDADRPGGRLAHPVHAAGGARRFPVAAAVRLCAVLDDGGGGPVDPDAGGLQQRQLHGDLPHHVPREHVRGPQPAAAGAADTSPIGTRYPQSPRPRANCSATPARRCPCPTSGRCRMRCSRR